MILLKTGKRDYPTMSSPNASVCPQCLHKNFMHVPYAFREGKKRAEVRPINTSRCSVRVPLGNLFELLKRDRQASLEEGSNSHGCGIELS